MREAKHEIIKCVTCGRPFKRALKKSKGRYHHGIRQVNVVNCSKECSKEYYQILVRKAKIKLKGGKENGNI